MVARSTLCCCTVITVLGMVVKAAWAAAPLGPVFTFQGRLMDDGQPANGTFGMDFRLFDADVTPPGVQIGSVISLSVPVTDGLFTVELNDADQFGLDAFSGDERWLEVTVNGTPLTPRQLITAAPYAQTAIEALSVSGIDGHSLDAADGAPVDALAVDIAGLVGIGTTSPERRLHVFDGSAGTVTSNSNAALVVEDSATAYLNFLTPDANESGILFGSPANAANGGILFNTSTVLDGLVFRTGGNATRMAIDGAGAVGIGTTTPGMELDVRSPASSAAGQVRAGNSTADTWVMLWSGFTNGSNDPAIIWSDDVAGDDLRFLTSSSGGTGGGEHMRITGAGNVGIGTTSPQVPLHVVGEVRAQGVGNRFASRNPDNTNAIVQLDWYDHPTDPAQNTARLRLGGSGEGAGNGIAFQGGGDVEWMRITTSGNVGIGTTSPSAALDVDGDIHASDVIETGATAEPTRLSNTLNNGGGLAVTRNVGPAQFVGGEVTYDGTSLKLLAGNASGGSLPPANGVVIDNSGNVGIGTTTPTGRLHVGGASGNASVVLPSSAISAVETADESGVANGRTDPDAMFSFGTSVFAVTTRAINCPAGGHVLVIGTVNLNAISDTLVWVGVSDSATVFPDSQKKYQTLLGTRWQTVTVQGLFSVNAGNNTFYLLVKDIEDNTNNFAGNAHLTLMYLPTTYGTVEPD